MSPGALLALALLAAQPRPLYHWRDAQGQTHLTNTPPPPGAERLDAPPPTAVEPGRPETAVHRADREDHPLAALTPAQAAAWRALDQRMALARSLHDTATLEAVADSLMDDCLWARGLWALLLLPVLSVALMGLLGWWLALGLGTAARLPILGGFLLLGLAFGQLLLASFLYYPQATRLRQSLQVLERHLGGRELSPAHAEALHARYRALERAADPLELPWRYPSEVAGLRRELKRVVVDP